MSIVNKRKIDTVNDRQNMQPTSLLTNTDCRADICKLKGWLCLKALITPLLRAPMWHCTLHHWKLVLLMLSRVKYGGIVGLGGNALFCWFKVGWSRNNGHEKNMAKLWEAANIHYFRRHGAQNGAWESGCIVWRKTFGLNDSSERYIYTSECTVMPLLF